MNRLTRALGAGTGWTSAILFLLVLVGYGFDFVAAFIAGVLLLLALTVPVAAMVLISCGRAVVLRRTPRVGIIDVAVGMLVWAAVWAYSPMVIGGTSPDLFGLAIGAGPLVIQTLITAAHWFVIGRPNTQSELEE